MRVLPLVAAVAFLATLLVPAAQGYPQPTFYFLKSGCPVQEVEGECYIPDVTLPDVPPLPPPAPPVPTVGVPKLVLADGILDPYDFLKPNGPNSTEPDLKPVYTASETAVPVRFLVPENHTHPNRLKGYFLVGVFTGQSAVPNGNLTATLYEVGADGVAKELLNATAAIDLNTSKAPEPTTLVPPPHMLPPNSTDPAVVAMSVAYYELGNVLPLVLQPPQVFLMGPVDLNFSNGSRLALGFHLTQGSSPSPEPPGMATISFNSTLNPSFVYVPWYAPDPPKPSKTSTFSATRSTGPRATGTGQQPTSDTPGAEKEKGNGIPGLEVSLAITMVAVAALVARRRL